MASVAICPHCYLQLVVPDGVERDEQVECPTCSREFSLDRAVLRAIPEVIRRSSSLAASVQESAIAPGNNLQAGIDEVVEDVPVAQVGAVEPASAEPTDVAATATSDNDFVAQLKSRVEQELSAGHLLPGMSTSLSLETPEGFDASPSISAAEPEPLDQWHRPTVRLSDRAELDAELEEKLPEPASESASDSIAGELNAEIEVEDAEYTPVDTNPSPPAAKTLAELMPPLEEESQLAESADAADAPGPSFELPDVQLTPSSSATVELDPNMPVGPAAESEFELDSVDFDSTPVEDDAARDIESEIDDDSTLGDKSETSDDEFAAVSAEEFVDERTEFDAAPTTHDEEPAEDDAPVIGESTTAASTPFILPGLPPRRRKRSVVRTLIGSALGGVVGAVGAFYALLWILGPDGDYLQVAKYLPSAALPKSFAATRPASIARTKPPKTVESEPVAAATTNADSAESENIPATFTEEVHPPEPASSVSETTPDVESANDNRYGEEPSPLDEPAAEPIADAVNANPETPLPLAGPTYTLQQLSETLNSAIEAQRGLVEGDLSDAAVRRTKGMSYAKLCDLAEALTFVERIGPTVEGEQAEQDAVRLFRETLSDAHTRSEVDRIATLWIDSPHRSHGGVFLAGELSGGEISGTIYEYELTIDGGSRFALLAAEPLDPSVQGTSQPIGIIGSIVENAPEKVMGYQGTAERAIWVTRAIPLD